MFVQIHMLQSMPPGNLNRDDTGQPKKCIFGGVTRGRISSQCLKRNIRHWPQFKEAFGDGLAKRTLYLPRMVADALRVGDLGVPDDELDDLMAAIAAKFKKEKRASESEDSEEDGEEQESSETASSTEGDGGKTGQLVFFPPPFAHRIAELVAALRKDKESVYRYFVTGEIAPESEEDNDEFRRRKNELKTRKAGVKKEQKHANTDQQKAALDEKKAELDKDEEAFKKEMKKRKDAIKDAIKAELGNFIKSIGAASESLTVDIALFGRMTTSDLVVNVEAACQVAHAIGTDETLIESDYFTAMDDLKATYGSTQTERAGAAFLGSGETETFFNSAVYYKYLNLDADAMRKHLPSLSDTEAARAVGALVSAAALANPTGKQNSFAAHGVPELILVEVSQAKRPISYANAFLQPVEGGTDRNLTTESAKALCGYIDSVAAAFAPADLSRVLLAVGPASAPLTSDHERVDTLERLVESVVGLILCRWKRG